MGKVVKYCTDCEEGFAEKFSFCPNCGGKLVAYEMSPLAGETRTGDVIEVPRTTGNFEVPAPVLDSLDLEPAPPTILTKSNFETNDEILEIEKVVDEPILTGSLVSPPENTAKPEIAPPGETFSEEVVQEPVVASPVASIVEAPLVTAITPKTQVYQQAKAGFADEKRQTNKKLDSDGFYSVTLVEDSGSGSRRALLLGSAVLVFALAIGLLVRDIYQNGYYVAALEDDLNSVVFVNDEPIQPEPEQEKPEIKKEDKESGGGGGGNKDPLPASKGKMADELKQPDVPPSVKLHQMDAELKQSVGVKSDRDKIQPPSDEPYGLKNSKYNVSSDGPGSGGGQGPGSGGGQGVGRGPGFNYGTGGGLGGNGPGGPGTRRAPIIDDGGDPPPAVKTPTPTPKPVGPTEGLKILAKPKATYTDAARQNQVQGTVRLKVTFNANGSIGSISALSTLPNGLTEQAIAAARNIRFEPAKVNGVPQTVTKTLEYIFNMY